MTITTMTTVTTTTTEAITMMMATTATRPARALGDAWRWQQRDFRAMNTAVHMSIYGPGERPVDKLVVELFRYFEQLLSRFRPTSELSRLNDHEHTAFAASPDLFAAVEAALWAAQLTDGIYDPTILPALERAGYDRTFDLLTPASADLSDQSFALAAADQLPPARPAFTYRDVALDRFTQMIYRPVGLRMDLGGMGKGWTVDRVADEIRSKGSFMLNAGGDLCVTTAPHRKRGWQVHLAHPMAPDRVFASLSLSNKALATSTIARRRWIKDGAIRHHLIDPRTGHPVVSDALSVSVVGERVFTAEVHAKVALILGMASGLAYLETQPDVEGILMSDDGALQYTSGLNDLLDRLDPNGYEYDMQGV